MYRLLVVDDEPDIVEGLYNFFFHYEGLELDVFKSYSGFDALNILNSERIDIVLSDICMPGMDGLELVKQIRKSWPYCQVIFLSGYTEFDYIYQAGQLEAVHYILKTEGYDKVAECVNKAVERIRNAIALNRIHEYWLDFKHEFVSSILKSTAITKDDVKQIMNNMNIALDPDRPVFLMAGCFTGPSEKSFAEQTKVYAMMNQLSCMHLLPRFQLLLDEYEKNKHIFIMQPVDADDDSVAGQYGIKLIKGLVEFMQNSFMDELGVALSFAIYGEPVPIQEIGGCYKKIVELLDRREASGVGIVIVNEALLSALHRREELHAIGETQAIALVKEYVAGHLHEQLSLTLLANLVYFNSSYLSRIFKKFTGVNLVSYITAKRVEKAKELLTGSNKKIHLIAAQLGFDSQSYFNQTFRKSTGLSPAEYRQQFGKKLL